MGDEGSRLLSIAITKNHTLLIKKKKQPKLTVILSLLLYRRFKQFR